MTIELNQSYKVSATLEEYSDIKKMKEEYERFCLETTDWGKYGRSYDCCVAMHGVDFNGKTICELGARDSLFSSYVTKFVEKVYASDTFIGWGDLGDLNHWDKLWKKSAINPERHVSHFQDMTRLSYDNNSMDVVVSFSAIEHIPGNGDIAAAKEMGRVCKPGGFVIIGTDMCRNHKWHGGGYFYDEDSLFERIINSTGCKLVGDYDFDFGNSDKNSFNGLEFTSVIFVLKKD